MCCAVFAVELKNQKLRWLLFRGDNLTSQPKKVNETLLGKAEYAVDRFIIVRDDNVVKRWW